MDFAFDTEQRLLREAVEDLLKPMRPQPGTAEPQEVEPWTALASAGMTGVVVPAELGGAGLGLVEAGCILEEIGATLGSGAFLSSAILAATLLRQLPASARRDEWLGRLASGALRLCVVPQPAATDGTAQPAPVLGFDGADCIFAIFQRPGEGGTRLAACSPSAVSADLLPWPDRSRPVHAVRVATSALAEALEQWDVPEEVVRTFNAVAAAALSAEMLGGASTVLAQACDYARERRQFGQQIGAFQSIKHLLADDRVILDGLRSLAYAALWQLQAGDPEGLATAHAAKAWAGDVYLRITSDAIQVFGAMGIAAESLPHRYLKRAQVDRVVFGTPAWHLEALYAYNAAL